MEYHTGTVTQIHRQLNADGHRVSENTIRTWVKQGILPAAYCGKKAYVSYENVVRILTNGTNASPASNTNGSIRRIDS